LSALLFSNRKVNEIKIEFFSHSYKSWLIWVVKSSGSCWLATNCKALEYHFKSLLKEMAI
jgi:hypothetical protein